MPGERKERERERERERVRARERERERERKEGIKEKSNRDGRKLETEIARIPFGKICNAQG